MKIGAVDARLMQLEARLLPTTFGGVATHFFMGSDADSVCEMDGAEARRGDGQVTEHG